MTRPRRLVAAVVFAVPLAALLAACTVSVAPVVASDPQTPCPGGSPEWTLRVVDQRAERKAVPNLEGPIRDSIVKSLPGCRWAASGAPTITIEVHRFSAVLDEVWEANAEWSVLVRDRDGRTLTEFQADAQVTRPNYRGSDNEKAALQEALEEAMRRTLAGIRSVSPSG
jgi:hypothetical protein